MLIRYKYFAIDFDGTIVGKELKLLPHVIETIHRIKDNDGEIAIWTCRTGSDLQQAIDILNDNNIPYDSINDILPSIAKQWGEGGRKIWAEVYIDDQSIHCRNGIDWYEIEKWIFEEEN